jgi:hypothetical protein
VLALEKDNLLLSKHLYLDNSKFTLLNERLPNTRWISEKENYNDPLCVRTLYRLEGHEFNIAVPTRYTNAYVALNSFSRSTDTNPWRIVDPAKRLSWARDFLRTTESQIKNMDTTYQIETFVPCTHVFNSLRPFRISKEIESTDDPVASTFATDENGFVNVPSYNRFGTRTGRTTVIAGPRVLTARIATRQFLQPVDDDHALVCLDYSALEARIALALANNQVQASQDPYEIIAKAIRLKSREEAKSATLTAIYSDPTANDRLDVKVSLVRRVFKLGEMYLSLSKERNERNGKVRNLYGRIIDVTGSDTLYNNYVQSTGADVVLLGFLSLLNKVEQLKVIPHFLLHDALFASVPKSNLQDLEQIGIAGVVVPKLNCVFPLKLTVLNQSTKF